MDVQVLREATRREHVATEALMPLSQPDVSMETYQGVVRALLPLVAGWEEWAERRAPESLRNLLPSRRRVHLLRQDLKTFGLEVSEVGANEVAGVDWDRVTGSEEGSAAGRKMCSLAGFLGAFYVMEGSTLGGRFLARHLEERLGLQPGVGNAFFCGHGHSTGAMWREVTAEIARVPEAQAACVIGAARRTFAAYGAVLARNLLPETLRG